MHRDPLPIELRGQPFSVTTGAHAGLTKCRMGATDLFRPARGARSDTNPATILELASATAVVLPDDVAFSHFTAAQIHELPLPRNITMQPLNTMRPSWKNPTRRRGFRGFRGLERRDVVDVKGIAVTSMADTWVDLAPFLPLDDHIALGDQVARRHDSTEQLHEALARRPASDRHRVALEALTLIRVGSDSPMETLSRLVFVRDGLPEPELNEPIFDDLGEGWPRLTSNGRRRSGSLPSSRARATSRGSRRETRTSADACWLRTTTGSMSRSPSSTSSAPDAVSRCCSDCTGISTDEAAARQARCGSRPRGIPGHLPTGATKRKSTTHYVVSDSSEYST